MDLRDRRTALVGVLTAAVTLSLGTGVLAQTDLSSVPPLVHVPPIRTPPKIDGVLSDGEWDRAFMGSGIARHRHTGLDPIPVEYWFAYDATNVYFAARMQTRPGLKEAALPRRFGGSGGPSGHFEILIDPHPGNPEKNWVQAMMYYAGKYKNVGYSQRVGGYVPYDVEWTYKDTWADGWFTIEMTTAAENLNRATLKNGQAWGVLFAGRIIAPGLHYISGQLGEPYRDRLPYLKMVLDKDAPVIRVAEMGDVSTGKVTPKIVVDNITGKKLSLTMSFSVRESYRQDGKALEAPSVQTREVAPGQQAELTWQMDVPTEKGVKYLWMTISETDGDKKLYEGIYKITKPRSPVWGEPPPQAPREPVIFEAWFFPYFNRVQAVADFGGLPTFEQVAEARFTVTDAAGKRLASGATRDFELSAAECILQLPESLAEGVYTVQTTLVDKAGKALGRATDTVEKKLFGFEHNQIGVSNDVLYPWTPIKVNEGRQTIEVWNRTYAMDESGFPREIESDGRQLLSGPIELVEFSDGRRTSLKGTSVTFPEEANHQVKAVAVAHGRKTKAEVVVHAEYDGMLKYEVTLSGEKGARVDGLDLLIPLKEEHARFLHGCGDGCRMNYSHELPEGRGKVWDSREVMNWVVPVQWLPYVWLGDHERGLCWWADSAEGWTLPKDKKTPVVEIMRRRGRVELVFHIVNRPATVLWRDQVPRRLVFALEATPMKPRPAWARQIGLCPTEMTKQEFPRFRWVGYTGWAFMGQKPGAYTWAYLRCVNEDAKKQLREHNEKAEASGRKTLVYTDMRSRALVGDLEKAYVWEWNPSRRDRRKAGLAKRPYWSAVGVNGTQSRIDYDLWCLKQGMDLGIDYWYFDEIQTEGQINPAAGLGYQDEDGNWMPTCRLFAYREIWKRLYTLMQQRGQQEPIIVIHNTSTTYAGPMAFCTTTWDFEDSNAFPKARQLTKYGIGYLITEAMGHQYGFVGSTLGPIGPGFSFERWLKGRPEEEVVAAARHWMGVHMLLDMNPYLTHHQIVRQGLKTLGEFGWHKPDCEWIPYWKARERKLYSWSPDERIHVSAYRRGERLLFILLNDSDQSVRLEWEPSRELKIGSLQDAEDSETVVTPDRGVFHIELPSYNYRAFLGGTR